MVSIPVKLRWFAAVLALYTALLSMTTPALADMTGAKQARAGDMQKLVFHDQPQPTSQAAFIDENGAQLHLADFRGQYLLINFWATWCAPCRKEMPTLSRLQEALGSERFKVITIATGRNNPSAIKDFFDKIEVDNLTLYRDPKQKLARDMQVLGLPVTVLVDPKGSEIARLLGDAEWASPSAFDVIRQLP